MTDKIREAFEKWQKVNRPENADREVCWEFFFEAGRQFVLDELEQVGFTAVSGHGRVLALQPTVQPEKWEPVYRLPEGVTK